jgi:hypothetical protein
MRGFSDDLIIHQTLEPDGRALPGFGPARHQVVE